MKKWIVAFLAIVILGGGAGGYFYWKKQNASKKDPAAELTTAKAERGPLRVSVASTGKIVANLDVDIKCKASGEIISLPFDVSNQVEKGQLLLELDPVDELRRVKQAEVQTSSSLARLEQARLNLRVADRNLATERQRAEAAYRSAEARAADSLSKANRIKELLAKNLSSQEEYDTAETAYVQASADLENARARLDDLKTQELSLELKRRDVALAQAQVETNLIDMSLAQQRLRDTKVLAPIDGVLSARSVQIGQIISSGINNVGGGTTALTLSDLSRLFVLASVDESDIGKVETGQTVRITADAFSDMRFEGEIVRVATRGVTSSNVVTFEVKIEITSENKDRLRPEMTANVEIIVAEKEDALLLPSEAISRRGRGERKVTLVGADGAKTEQAVEIGLTDGVKTEIVSGLEAGQTVAFKKSDAESRWRPDGQGRGGPGGQGGATQMRMMMGGQPRR